MLRGPFCSAFEGKNVAKFFAGAIRLKVALAGHKSSRWDIIVIYITREIKPSFHYPCVAVLKFLAVAGF